MSGWEGQGGSRRPARRPGHSLQRDGGWPSEGMRDGHLRTDPEFSLTEGTLRQVLVWFVPLQGEGVFACDSGDLGP